LILAAVAVLVVPLAAAAGKSGNSQQAADYTARWLDTQNKLTALAAAPMGPHGPELARDGGVLPPDQLVDAGTARRDALGALRDRERRHDSGRRVARGRRLLADQAAYDV